MDQKGGRNEFLTQKLIKEQDIRERQIKKSRSLDARSNNLAK